MAGNQEGCKKQTKITVPSVFIKVYKTGKIVILFMDRTEM